MGCCNLTSNKSSIDFHKWMRAHKVKKLNSVIVCTLCFSEAACFLFPRGIPIPNQGSLKILRMVRILGHCFFQKTEISDKKLCLFMFILKKGGKFEKKSNATFTGKANKVILVLLRIIQCRNIKRYCLSPYCWCQ